MTKLQKVEIGLAVAMPVSTLLAPIWILRFSGTSLDQLVTEPIFYQPLAVYLLVGLLAVIASIRNSKLFTVLLWIPLLPIVVINGLYAVLLGAYLSSILVMALLATPGLIYAIEAGTIFLTRIDRWRASSKLH